MNTSFEPIVDLTIDDDEVKRRTGYISLDTMLIYIFIVCNGDVNVILSRSTSLTWFEEWFAHLEYKWGRTITRIWDGRKLFGISSKLFHAIVRSKYKIERSARESWPPYASHLEDKELRDPLWNLKYADDRVEELDMTDISAFGFSDPDLQRLTYSKYYNGNVLKGGVGVQLCGLMYYIFHHICLVKLLLLTSCCHRRIHCCFVAIPREKNNCCMSITCCCRRNHRREVHNY